MKNRNGESLFRSGKPQRKAASGKLDLLQMATKKGKDLKIPESLFFFSIKNANPKKTQWNLFLKTLVVTAYLQASYQQPVEGLWFRPDSSWLTMPETLTNPGF